MLQVARNNLHFNGLYMQILRSNSTFLSERVHMQDVSRAASSYHKRAAAHHEKAAEHHRKAAEYLESNRTCDAEASTQTALESSGKAHKQSVNASLTSIKLFDH